MRPPNLKGLSAGVLLMAIAGCSLLQPLNPASPPPSPSPSVATPSTPKDPGYRPESRVVTMSVEGQPTEVELKLFDQPELPFTTYVPVKDFVSEVTPSESEMAIHFYFSPTNQKDEKAFIQLFFPTQSMSTAEMQELLLGESGLFVTNGWELADRTDIVSYPWAKEKLIYQQRTATEMVVGAIYISEHNGQAFYALTHYPAEYADGFEPRSNLILENLQFRDQKN